MEWRLANLYYVILSGAKIREADFCGAKNLALSDYLIA